MAKSHIAGNLREKQAEIDRLEEFAETVFNLDICPPSLLAEARAAQARADVLIDQMFETPCAAPEDRAAKVSVLKRHVLGPEWLRCLALGDLQQTRTDAVLGDLG